MTAKDKVFIFDFDGVLAHSEDVIFEALNYALAKLRLKNISIEEFQQKSKIELLNQRKINKFKFFILIMFARQYMSSQSHRIIKNNDLIKIIKSCPYDCYIVSSNTTSIIKKTLGADSIFFKSIKGGIGLYSKHKILKKYPTSAIYITDEVRDIIACQKVGMTVYASTWGVDSRQSLEEAKPNGILESFEDILSLF
jgi:phosphoglycolate phosphatase